jgi:DNA-binding transcriptional LysR family regulator
VNLAAVNLNLLVALEALLEEAHVGAAGRRVGLSQPAMSHALAQLRTHFGDAILVRSGSGMARTPFAEGLRPRVREALGGLAQLMTPAGFDPRTSRRRFRLAMSDYAAYVVFPRLRSALGKKAAGIELDLALLGPESGSLDDLGRSVDVVVTCDPSVPSGFRSQPLFVDRDVLVFRTGSTWSKVARSVPAFLAAPHVAVVEAADRPDPVDAWLTELGLSRRVVARVPQYVLALQLVADSDLVAVVPERLVVRCSQPLGLRHRDLPLDAGSFTELLLHPARADGDPGNAWLRGELSSLFHAAPPRSPTPRRPRPKPAAVRPRA